MMSYLACPAHARCLISIPWGPFVPIRTFADIRREAFVLIRTIPDTWREAFVLIRTFADTWREAFVTIRTVADTRQEAFVTIRTVADTRQEAFVLVRTVRWRSGKLSYQYNSQSSARNKGYYHWIYPTGCMLRRFYRGFRLIQGSLFFCC